VYDDPVKQLIISGVSTNITNDTVDKQITAVRLSLPSRAVTPVSSCM